MRRVVIVGKDNYLMPTTLKVAGLIPALLLFALLLAPSQARADNVIITSGSVSIGGAPLSRGAFRNISFSFAGSGLHVSGGAADQIQQRVLSACTFGPCAPGTVISGSSESTLYGVGQATVNGVTSDAWYFRGDSLLSFRTPDLVIPNSTAPQLTLTVPFTMTGTAFIYELNDFAHPLILSTQISGSGIATLQLLFINGGYAISDIRYDFQPIPEPATLILLGTGLAGLAARRRRRRDRSGKLNRNR